MPPATEIDLCRRQLAGVHDTADASERQMVLLTEKMRADQTAAALREADLATWFRAYFVEAGK